MGDDIKGIENALKQIMMEGISIPVPSASMGALSPGLLPSKPKKIMSLDDIEREMRGTEGDLNRRILKSIPETDLATMKAGLENERISKMTSKQMAAETKLLLALTPDERSVREQLSDALADLTIVTRIKGGAVEIGGVKVKRPGEDLSTEALSDPKGAKDLNAPKKDKSHSKDGKSGMSF